MRIWNARKLAEEFANGEVSEKQQLAYLITYVALTFVVADPYFNILGVSEISTIDLWLFLVGLVLIIAGTIACFLAVNPDHAHPGFIARYICLGLPTSVQLLVFTIGPLILLFTIIGFIDPDHEWLESGSASTLDFLLGIFVLVAFFYYLRNLIKHSYAKPNE